MNSKPLEEAVDRVERALIRIERAVEQSARGSKPGAMDLQRDEQLRSKVAAALGELDSIIKEVGHG